MAEVVAEGKSEVELGVGKSGSEVTPTACTMTLTPDQHQAWIDVQSLKLRSDFVTLISA